MNNKAPSPGNVDPFENSVSLIVEGMNSITDLNVLFNFIFNEIALLLDFELAGASLFNSSLDGIEHEQFFNSGTCQDFEYAPMVYKGLEFEGSPLAEIVKFKSPKILDNDFWSEGFKGFLTRNRTTKIFSNQLYLPLPHNGTNLGIIAFYSVKAFQFTPSELKQLERLGIHVGLMCRLIISQARIQDLEDERMNLLAISNGISTIQGKSDLLNVIVYQLKKLLPFDLVVINAISYDGRFKSNLLTHAADGFSSDPAFGKTITDPYHIVGTVFDKILTEDMPCLWNIDELLEWTEPPVHLKVLKAEGVINVSGIALREKGKAIATLFFYSKNKNPFCRKELSLIRDIAYQLSVAVANILGNERIEQRESEKENLLKLGNDLAAIRGINDLPFIIDKHLKKLFPASDVAIRLIDYQDSTHSVYFAEPGSVRRGHPGFAEMMMERTTIYDGVVNSVLESREPLILDLEEMVQAGLAPGYQRFNYQAGMKETLNIPLIYGDKVIGIFILFSEERKAFSTIHINLFSGIANQLSIAVANILANEEIMANESEKSILLALNNEISAIKNLADLLMVIDQKLRALFPNKEFWISLISEDRTQYSLVPCGLDSRLSRLPDSVIVSKVKYHCKDGFFDSVSKLSSPAVFDINLIRDKPDYPVYLDFFSENGSVEFTAMPLRVGNEDLGILWAFSDAKGGIPAAKFNLLKGICAQISVAASNIFAYQRIEKQLDEIEGYKHQLQEEKKYLREELETTYNYTDIVGDSEKMKSVFHLVSQVSQTDSSVLLLGETGTGKEMIARAIHNSSRRKDKLMVKVNCATLPPNLIESELFGHERGSFTGATERRIGKFELANKGTLFLDEIGELPLELQVKLLRALQEKEIERVGGRLTIKTDVRIVAATNRDLYQEVQAGRFRSDLFFRLDVFPITLPPLRERQADISLLTMHFIKKISKKLGKNVNTITARALQSLERYSWPGNVRELEHLIERSILLASGNVLNNILLPSAAATESNEELLGIRVKSIDEIEREHIMMVLKKCKGRVAGAGGAAELLGIPSTTLNSKIKRLGIKKQILML